MLNVGQYSEYQGNLGNVAAPNNFLFDSNCTAYTHSIGNEIHGIRVVL